MNKPTHILVPIEFIQDLIDSYNVIPLLEIDYADAAEIDLLNKVMQQPKVDLSEEGMKNKATKSEVPTKLQLNHIETIMYNSGYKQCAKDLLNTKP